jgi:alkanesulfonate monooxygenase SsuD/methylene tetrahydromethanopterin reductase-like flavin-dependent oxidoreductase (luciferase family)
VRRAGRLADGFITEIAPMSTTMPLINIYRDECAKHGRPSTVILTRAVGIGRTRRQVEEEWLPGIKRQYQDYVRSGVIFTNRTFVDKVMSDIPLTLDDCPSGQFIAGTPDDCIKAVKAFKDQSACDYIVGDFGHAAHGAEYERIRASIELFGREVVPAFQHA